MLPRVLLDRAAGPTEFPALLAVRAEHLDDFLVARLRSNPKVSRSRGSGGFSVEENGARLEAIERRGYRGFVPARRRTCETEALQQALELWHTRPRDFPMTRQGFRERALLDRIIALVGRDLACHVVFADERAYWQSRNRAAQMQKPRQDQLGLGWGNHDHHTFRCSREHFVDLMRVLGSSASSGANATTPAPRPAGARKFSSSPSRASWLCDVDLMPEETEMDFSRSRCRHHAQLGTVGLWVGLHGESFLEAGHAPSRMPVRLSTAARPTGDAEA